jgi:hypothetical protein
MNCVKSENSPVIVTLENGNEVEIETTEDGKSVSKIIYGESIINLNF